MSSKKEREEELKEALKRQRSKAQKTNLEPKEVCHANSVRGARHAN